MSTPPQSPCPRWSGLLVAAVLAIGACAGGADAQTSPPSGTVSFSVGGGLTFASLTVPLETFPIPEVELSNGRRLGFVGGAIVEIQAAPAVSIDTGALFSQRGMTMKVSSPLFGSGEADLLMNYLDLPAHVRIGVAGGGRSRLSLLAGPTIGVKLHARTRAEAAGQTMEMDFTSELPAIDVGLSFGGRLDVGRALVAVTYLYGLTDQAKGDSPETVKHRVWSVVAGWRF